MAALAVLVLWRVELQMSAEQWVEHTHGVMLEAKEAEIHLQAMQVNVRSLALTGDGVYQTGLRDAEESLARAVARLSSMVMDNPVQERRLLELSGLRGKWVATAASIGGADARSTYLASVGELEATSRAIRGLLEEIVATERELLSIRSAARARQDRLIFVMVPLLSILIAALLSYLGWRQISVASEQFAKALASAEESSRLKDNFLATVSHELRNPLNTILLRCHLLLAAEPLSESARRGVTILERSAKAQAQLIEDLLDVSRIESGRLRLDLQSTDLVEVVRAAVDAMRAAAEAKSITLQETIDPRVSPIAGDPQRLQQVVWNLVSNAVKFTPRGGRIQIRLERINSHIEITVADNGRGIEAASIEHVFDRFWQAPGSERNEAGIGLGLSIVKQLVALHGGTVTAHSDGPGKGATFTVRLPLPVSSAALLELPRRHPTIAPMTHIDDASRLEGLSLLVVDDEASACEALKELLVALGARVVTANSADEGLEALNGLEPDAIVCDIGMPVRDGLSLAREVRQRERNSGREARVPLIALTAYGRVEDKIQILNAGFDTHVVKPVEMPELSAIIKSLVGARLEPARRKAEI